MNLACTDALDAFSRYGQPRGRQRYLDRRGLTRRAPLTGTDAVPDNSGPLGRVATDRDGPADDQRVTLIASRAIA